MYLITCTGDFVTIRMKTFPRSLRLAVILLICSACLMSTSWSQSPQPHVVVGRVQIPAINHPLKLAEPNQISIQLAGESVTAVTAKWTYYVGDIPHPAAREDSILPVKYDSSGGAFVNATPLKLGKAQLTLLIAFADGGFERKKIDVRVVQPERQPERLVITSEGGDYRRDTPVLYLDLSEADRTAHVFPAVIYKNVTHPIRLNASDVTFRLINSIGAAEIDSSTGIVTARNVGQALLETSFGGVSVLTCIDVMNNVLMGPRSRCKELLPPGRKLPPSGMELDPTPGPVVKAYPH
jgi:hypothetical protein